MKRLRSSFCYQLPFGIERYYHCYPGDSIPRRLIQAIVYLFVL